jgi:predicted secreted Zn-dependent protease
MPVRSAFKTPPPHPAAGPGRRLPGRLAVAGAFLALLPLGLAQPQNKLLWRTNYYSITGASFGEIRRSIEQSRPWKDSEYRTGLTEWQIDWRFEVTPGGDGCRCSSFNTTTTITNSLPRWTPPTEATAEVKAAWGRFIQALGVHEDGHSRLALAAVAELHKRIKELGPAPDCEGLRKRINAIAERVIEEHRQRERDYDRRTHHGETQGAALRL